MQRVAYRPQRELQRLARNTVHERPHSPSQPMRNRARERHRLNLNQQPAVAFGVAPVGVLPPQKAMLVGRAQRVLGSSIRVLRETQWPWLVSSRPKRTSYAVSITTVMMCCWRTRIVML